MGDRNDGGTNWGHGLRSLSRSSSSHRVVCVVFLALRLEEESRKKGELRMGGALSARCTPSSLLRLANPVIQGGRTIPQWRSLILFLSSSQMRTAAISQGD